MSYLDLVKLTKLMELTEGKSEIKVGVIDGPVFMSHPNIESGSIYEVPSMQGTCANTSSAACMHGTFVAGILSGKRGSNAPSICPGCTLLVCPIFTEASGLDMPSATPKELAEAIVKCINAGAQVLNLSVALTYVSKGQRELDGALDYAAKRGVITIAAAGNQSMIGSSVITRHPWVIPVAACDANGRPINESNLGISIGKQGLMAPGENITSLAAGGGFMTLGGTSIAVPFVTGTAALLWSQFPDATAAELKLALMQGRESRRAILPPLLNAWDAYRFMSISHSPQFRGRLMEQTEVIEQSKSIQLDEVEAQTKILTFNHMEANVSPQCANSAGEDTTCPNASGKKKAELSYVYAIGRIETRFPTLGVEKEFAQAMGREDLKGLTDQQALHSVLSKPENCYLMRQVCWVFTIEGIEIYILQPRDFMHLNMLMDAIRQTPRQMDVDVIIGMRGPIAPPEVCNGLIVPIVLVDQVYSFDVDSLVKSIPRPEMISEEKFGPAAEELFNRIMQMADNAGATDENRALNYLAVRYPNIYSLTSDQYGKNFSLTAVDVLRSRMSGTRKIVDVVFTYTNRQTGVDEKFFVRVDVTEEFPFLVTKMSPYYNR